MSIHFTAPFHALKYHLEQISDNVTKVDLGSEGQGLIVFGAINVVKKDNIVIVEVKFS